jgi:conjugal transfer pilus assembly protein TraB
MKGLDGLKQKWEELKPDHKKKIVFAVFLAVLILLGTIGNSAKQKAIEAKKSEVENRTSDGRKQLQGEMKLFEKNEISEIKGKMSGLEKDVSEMKQSIDDVIKKIDEKDIKKDFPGNSLPQNNPLLKRGSPNFPAPNVPNISGQINIQQPMYPSVSSPGNANTQGLTQGQGTRPVVETMGDIEFTPGHPTKREQTSKDGDKKKEERKINLPSGTFFKGVIIVGGDVETLSSGKGEPEPILIRAKDIAVLPNDVKKRVDGCFVTGEMVGSLSKECVKTRLLSLACIDKKGNALIDQPIEGYVADESGRNCIRGEVVWKGGVLISRALWASIFGGVGKAVTAATSPTSAILPIGTAQTEKPNIGEAFSSGMGSSFSQATEDVKKIFIDLLKQTSPSIGIGVSREVTIIIRKGVDLDIKELNK